MSYDGYETDVILAWSDHRKLELEFLWSEALGLAAPPRDDKRAPHHVLADDALEEHVRVERWAHMRGEPAPNLEAAIKATTERLRALDDDACDFDGALPEPRIGRPAFADVTDDDLPF